MKIAVIGYSGSGKSTLAKQLGQIYVCPVLYLDTVQFEAGWKERNREEAKEIVKKFMNHKSWVIDGNYTNFYYQERLEEADQIIFMNFPRRVCLYRAYKRYFQNRNQTRESMAEGCTEKIDFEFVKWILLDGRNRARKAQYQTVLSTYPGKTVELRTKKEVARWFEGLNG